MTLSPTMAHLIHAEAGRKGGLSRSPAKVAATRASIAKAREVMRCKRLAQRCPGPIVDGVDSVTMAPIADQRELMVANRYRKVAQ